MRYAPTPVTEAEAIALCRRGDQQAFAWLVHTYKHMVYTLTMQVLRHREEAEEAAQDAFVKAYRNLGGYSGQAKFSTWLYSITYHTAISKLRARKAVARDLAEVPETSLAGDPDRPWEHHDRKRALDAALALLPAEDAAVVGLYYFSEQSVEEIVTATGLSASNVKVKLHRSRKRLFEVLRGHLKEELWTLHEE